MFLNQSSPVAEDQYLGGITYAMRMKVAAALSADGSGVSAEAAAAEVQAEAEAEEAAKKRALDLDVERSLKHGTLGIELNYDTYDV